MKYRFESHTFHCFYCLGTDFEQEVHGGTAVHRCLGRDRTYVPTEMERHEVCDTLYRFEPALIGYVGEAKVLRLPRLPRPTDSYTGTAPMQRCPFCGSCTFFPAFTGRHDMECSWCGVVLSFVGTIDQRVIRIIRMPHMSANEIHPAPMDLPDGPIAKDWVYTR